MIEKYDIRLRTGRGEETKELELMRNGKYRKKVVFLEFYQTKGGETLFPDDWRKKALEAARADGLLDLLEALKEYCRTHLAWLHKEEEVEEHALECLAGGSYLYWDDFRCPGRILFRFDSQEKMGAEKNEGISGKTEDPGSSEGV